MTTGSLRQPAVALQWNARRIGACVLLAAAALLPALSTESPFLVVLASHALIAAMLAVSLDVLTGNTGLLSFGHAAWFGLGGYTAGLFAKSLSTELVPVVLAAAGVALVLSALVGHLFLRQIGKAFAILTLAFGQVLYALVFVLSRFTGGEDGLQGVPAPTMMGAKIVAQDTWYWLLLGLLVVMLALTLYVRSTPLGKAWLGVRENPERAQFIGLDVFRLKLLAYVGSATLAAVAGAFFVLFNGAISPEAAHWLHSGQILMYVVLGGVGTLVGPALGAVVFTFAEDWLSSMTDAWLVYFGALFVIVVIVAPGGLYRMVGTLWQSATRKERQ